MPNNPTYTFADDDPKSETKQPNNDAQTLLNWILGHWKKSVICLRDVRAFGPHSMRDEKIAISSIETLAKNGWLVARKAHRRDRRLWEITHRPIANPTVPAE